MATIKEEAQDYEPQLTKNIAELEAVSVDLKLETREKTDKNGQPFTYKVTIIDGEEYRVPISVLKSLKSILDNKPDLKQFKVVVTGEGLNTSYTVIPVE